MKAMKGTKAMKTMKATQPMKSMKDTKAIQPEDEHDFIQLASSKPWGLFDATLECQGQDSHGKPCPSWIFMRRFGMVQRCTMCNRPWHTSYPQGANWWTTTIQEAQARKAMKAMEGAKAMKPKVAMKSMKGTKAMKPMVAMKAMKGTKAMKPMVAMKAMKGTQAMKPKVAMKAMKAASKWVAPPWEWNFFHAAKKGALCE